MTILLFANSLSNVKSSLLIICLLFITANSLAADGISYDLLSIPVQGNWKRLDQNGYAVFSRPGKPGGLLLLKSMKGGPEMLERFLTRLMEAHAEGRTLAKVFPEKIARGKTRSGLSFAGQGRVTTSEKDTWYCQYFAFDLGGSLQAFVAFAETAESFKELSAAAGPALELAAAIPPQTVPTAEIPSPATGPTSMHQQTGIMPDQFVSGVISAQSAELKPIQFRITGGMALSTDDLVLSNRDETGAIYVTRDSVGAMANLDLAREIHRIQDFGRPQKTGLSREFLMKAVAQLGKEKVDLFFVGTSPVHHLSVDRKGNLFMGQTIDDHNAFLLRSSAGITLIASPSQLRKAANGYNTNRDASRIRPTSRGNAWLFVQGPEPDGKNYGTIAYALLKTNEGFKSKQVIPSFKGKPYGRAAAYSLFNNVAVDQDENLVFYSRGSFWRIQPDGAVTEILKLPLPSENVTISGPVIQENGDMWLAFSTQYHVTSYANVTGGTADIRNTWFMVGDRSRLVRIRMKGGKVELGEISSERLLDALRKSGIVRSDSGVMKTALLRLDYKTGGLVLADSHHSVLYGLSAD